MITLPESLQITRNKKAERVLVGKARKWVEGGERTPGVHASDILDPRLAFWKHKFPNPIPDRLVNIFLIGRVLHAFVLSAVKDVKGVDWATDSGSKTSEELGIEYSPDDLDGEPAELKTTRSFYLPKTIKDLETYAEQLLIYMAAEDKTQGKLWVLFLNVKDASGQTAPEFRAYTVKISEEDLAKLKLLIKDTGRKLTEAKESGNPKELPLCRQWKCGPKKCEFWGECKPEGRFPLKTQKAWKV